MEGAEQDERYRPRRTMNHQQHANIALHGHEGFHKSRKSGFAKRADRQAGEGYSDLHAGNDAAEIAEKFLYNFGLGVALGDQLTYAGHSYGDKRKFHGRKKTV